MLRDHLAIDRLLAAEELVGFALSNRVDTGPAGAAAAPVRVVLIADRFPARGDPLVDFAPTGCGRPDRARRRGLRPVPVQAARELEISYREDDGAAA